MLTGTVTSPNGLYPIPDAFVSIPRGVYPFPATIACDNCARIGDNAFTSTKTRSDGTFALEVPDDLAHAGSVTVVTEKGRFRRVSEVPLDACAMTELAEDAVRLPGRRDQYPNTIPNIAVAQGHFDEMECMLLRLGIEAGQFDLYNGRCELPDPPTFDSLLANPALMDTYNMIFINCKGDNCGAPYKPPYEDPTIRETIRSYIERGGRLFATDFAYDYLEQIDAFAPIIDFEPGTSGSAAEPVGAARLGDATTTAANVNDDGLARWLRAVEARTGQPIFDASNRIPVRDFRAGWAMQRTAAPEATVWLEAEVGGITIPEAPRPLTTSYDYNQCGRWTYASYHTIGGGAWSAFPTYCNAGELSAQELTLLYLILHTADCVQIL